MSLQCAVSRKMASAQNAYCEKTVSNNKKLDFSYLEKWRPVYISVINVKHQNG